MAQMLIGSLNLTAISENFKKKHTAFKKGKSDGKDYVDVVLWVNDVPDERGQTVSIQLNSTKEMRKSEGKVYIGNAKPLPGATATQQPLPISQEENIDLPF